MRILCFKLLAKVNINTMQHQLKKIKGVSQITYKLQKTAYTVLMNSETLELETEEIFKNVSKGELNNQTELLLLFEHIKAFNSSQVHSHKPSYNKKIIIDFIKKYGYIQTPNTFKQQELSELKRDLHLYLQSKLLKDNKFLSDLEITEIIKLFWGKFFDNNYKIMGNDIINYIVSQTDSLYSKINFLIVVNYERKNFLEEQNLLFKKEGRKLIIFLDTRKFKWFRDLFNENLWEFEIRDFEVEEEIICE